MTNVELLNRFAQSFLNFDLLKIIESKMYSQIYFLATREKSISKVIEPAHKLKIDQNKLQNCRSNILNLVNVL
ncbi:hypothetical protein D1AOALGA4SA_12452 [Olavius algarvensis Delta 1 endosymbiont]|nr:hypothetical protein D1AOALGA4SA_12452 [Olavius algarvensis Delta 1 endosymbiont]